MSSEDREYLGSLQNGGGAGWKPATRWTPSTPEEAARYAADMAYLSTPEAQAELRAEMEWEARVS